MDQDDDESNENEPINFFFPRKTHQEEVTSSTSTSHGGSFSEEERATPANGRQEPQEDEHADRPRRIVVDFGKLFEEVREFGLSPITFLPVLGREGYIREHRAHILAAAPKVGKTELIFQAIQEWHDKEVLYLTEESEESWQDRAWQLSESERTFPPGRMTLVFAYGLTRATILHLMDTTTADVIVIDTIRDIIQPEDENDAAKVREALLPFVSSARNHKKTLILLHHRSKGAGGGRGGRGVTGSHAFVGTMDIFLEIMEDQRKGYENRRYLSGRGRILNIPDLVYTRDSSASPLYAIDLDDGAERNLVESLVTAIPIRTKFIHEASGIQDHNRVLNYLKELARAGCIEREPPMSEGDKRGVTYLWKKAQGPMA